MHVGQAKLAANVSIAPSLIVVFRNDFVDAKDGKTEGQKAENLFDLCLLIAYALGGF